MVHFNLTTMSKLVSSANFITSSTSPFSSVLFICWIHQPVKLHWWLSEGTTYSHLTLPIFYPHISPWCDPPSCTTARLPPGKEHCQRPLNATQIFFIHLHIHPFKGLPKVWKVALCERKADSSHRACIHSGNIFVNIVLWSRYYPCNRWTVHLCRQNVREQRNVIFCPFVACLLLFWFLKRSISICLFWSQTAREFKVPPTSPIYIWLHIWLRSSTCTTTTISPPVTLQWRQDFIHFSNNF